jgi:hypothetical protein
MTSKNIQMYHMIQSTASLTSCTPRPINYVRTAHGLIRVLGDQKLYPV